MTTETLMRPAPVEVVSPIKPSEAIRLGCLLAPVQAFGSLWGVGHRRGDGHACVVGSMLLGGFPERGIAGWTGHEVPCPQGCPRLSYEGGTVPHLNDDHHWSRERIADWLESLGL